MEAHTRALANVFQMGQELGEKEEARVRRSMNMKATIIPQLILTQKDHKKFSGKVPQTRPICSAGQTINQRVSDLVTDSLQALFKAEPLNAVAQKTS